MVRTATEDNVFPIIPDLADKVFLVTGASSGIGAALARALGAQRARVAVHYFSGEEGARAVIADIENSGGQAVALRGDLAQIGAGELLVAAAVERFGRLDCLINNAGNVIKRIPLAEQSEAFFDEMINLNVRAVVAASRAAIPHFRRQGGGGNIISTSSVAARTGGGPGAVLYGATKGFVSTFTRGLAKELAGDRIRVNAVAPGVILTPLHERLSNEQQMRFMLAGVPMGRAGSSEECVGAYLYLASDTLSSYVTGQVIEVNGGQLTP
jgi:3-oxoacyl-[acyl-carrier protein] reductase